LADLLEGFGEFAFSDESLEGSSVGLTVEVDGFVIIL
jgi:hypothetical protein